MMSAHNLKEFSQKRKDAFDLLVIFGKGLAPGEQGNPLGNLGGEFRVSAGAVLYHRNKEDARVIVSGGARAGDTQPLASVMRRELEEYGVSASHIIEEDESKSTYQQLRWLEQYLTEHQPRSCTIVTNAYHVPRTEIMAACAVQLDGNVSFISAESVLLSDGRDPAFLEQLYQTPELEGQWERELEGIRDLLNGTYQFR